MRKLEGLFSYSPDRPHSSFSDHLRKILFNSLDTWYANKIYFISFFPSISCRKWKIHWINNTFMFTFRALIFAFIHLPNKQCCEWNVGRKRCLYMRYISNIEQIIILVQNCSFHCSNCKIVERLPTATASEYNALDNCSSEKLWLLSFQEK